MGLTIVWEDEDHKAIQTLSPDLDYEAWDHINLDEFILLKYVDFYGNTTFNTLQLDDLVTDLHKLKKLVPAQATAIQHIIELAGRCSDDVHTYITFYGD
jgi:hypothetical protein